MFGIVLILIASILFPSISQGAMIKEPNVAGQFYSADPKELSAHIDYLKESAGNVPSDRKVVMAIAPHAGYVFSGPIAAYTYKAIARNHYKTIVILAPSHYFPFEGIAVWPQGGFKTPLGIMDVDEDFARALLKENPKFQILPQVFEQEHSIEVQLPFLQKTFSNVKIVPILMGQPDFKVCEDLAAALNKLIGQRDDVLVLLSSDMSHYRPYEITNEMDARTLKAVTSLDAENFFNNNLNRSMEMCGFMPVTTGILYAKLRSLKHIDVLKYANSGDTSGDKSKVVGYSSVIFYSDLLPRTSESRFNATQKKELLTIARSAMESFVKTGKPSVVPPKDPTLNAMEGAFVTLKKQGSLRGCIGAMVGQQALWQTVRDMAVAAASQDPRFPVVTVDELKDINLEISVLSNPVQVKDSSAIELGKHGVIVSDGQHHQGVFLPQVADETGWNKEDFLSQLCSQKAGLPSDCWKDPKNSLYVFTADVFGE